MSKSPARLTETSARWNDANRKNFQDKVDAGIIDIDNTTPRYIDSIHQKFWGRKNLSPSMTTTGHSLLLFEQSERPLALEPVSFFHILCTHPLPLNSPVDAVRTAFAAASTTDKVNNNNEYAADDTDDTANGDDEPPAIMVTTNKKTTTAAAAAATKKSGFDKITSVLNKMKVSVSASTAPAITSYSTKVFDPFLIHLVTNGGKQFLEIDVCLAASFMCEDIAAVLLPDGMSVSLQGGGVCILFYNQALAEGPW
jgi:hypothetical protein